MERSRAKTYRNECTVFDRFSLSRKKKGYLCAENSYGCRTKDGALVYGAGANFLQIGGVDLVAPRPGTYKFSFVPYRISVGEVRLPVLCDASGVHIYDEGQKGFKMVIASGANVSLLPVYLGNDIVAMLIFTQNSVWKFDSASWITKVLDGGYKSPCVYRSRIFGVKGENRIVYSGAYDRLNFEQTADEGGYIDVGDAFSAIKKLLPLEKEMYVFFESEIYRLTGDGAASEFRLEKVPYMGGVIYPSTIAASGEEVIFWAEDGMYKIKGGKVEPFAIGKPLYGYTPLATDAIVSENYYRVPCRIVGDNDKIIEINVHTGEVGYTHFTSVLCRYEGCAYGVDRQRRIFAYRTGFPLQEDVYFEAKGLHLGKEGDKTLKKLRIYGKGELIVYASSRGRTFRDRIELSDTGTEVKMAVKGDVFDFKFKLNPDTMVERVEAYTLRAE